MSEPIKQLPTFVKRTYRGGAVLKHYLGMKDCEDSFFPEDWISSFTEAKNKEFVKNEGITRVQTNNVERLLTDVVTPDMFGTGRHDGGILIKFLDSAERLGIQVHPDKNYAQRIFHTPYGKTESWHILDTRDNGTPAEIFLGFREFVTREIWADLFRRQDINGMLNAMHRFEVKPGDTILVTGGMPHAIGAGCFLLELQEPTDYTMRVERVTVSGDTLTPMQLHYGAGEENMLDCFDYSPKSREQIIKRFFLKQRVDESFRDVTHLITYDDTNCFKLNRIKTKRFLLREACFTTIISIADGGSLSSGDMNYILRRGDKFFVPANVDVVLENAQVLVCYPPKI